ncbi:2-succinyl-5-enolpyruvyl-6-hydroxy-3-cyclohexene-1-carboxylic-acid synthase [Halarchaeum sp. P4]|uniref:2-succinyl-5-enolpyruvyl-6-hydroxy-3- cyclohexene-1-carboxylic-acid synthase n=1 Tax=Halarchaeum sp. P4 TaxID=3421639 RepID=UPI003EB92728
MTDDSGDAAPNRATLHARVLVDELVKAGVSAVCVAPGSRSTPLTVAFDAHEGVTTYSHLDERSASFFALGRAKRAGEPVALVCTSGTAAANFHPAVIEANQSRVPLVVLTADRPPELRDSGANQTIDQEKLYGDAVRYYTDLPEPAVEARTLRSVRVTADRAVAAATGTHPGPVHLNVPFAKPLEPTETPAPPESPHGVPDGWESEHALAAQGRDGPFVATAQGRLAPDDATLADLADAVETAERGLIVAGPTDRDDTGAITSLAGATGFPILADPLSGLRYGPHTDDVPVYGGYDGYLDPDVTADWPDPDLVVRFGASPTSKPLRRYLARTGTRQVVVDPAGEWREATFTATDLVVADPGVFADRLAARVETESADWPAFAEAERVHAAEVEAAEAFFEGAVARRVVADAPDPATLFVSNSMPVRDVDRYGAVRDASLSVLGNRGASGIDGITSSALGAGSATDDPLVLLTGDLAYYHDMNGLLALERCGVDATVVLVNNDGGGIFHMLPIEAFDPPFEGQFKTPHGLDFAPTAELYGLSFTRTEHLETFENLYRASVESEGTQVIEVASDAEASHRVREQIAARVHERLA